MNRLAKQRQTNSRYSPAAQMRSVANSTAIVENTGAGNLRFKDNRPENIAQQSIQKLSKGHRQTLPASFGVTQFVFHKGKTAKSATYSRASSVRKIKPNGTAYTTQEIQRFINSKRHYWYNSETQCIEKIQPKPKAKKKTTSSKNDDSELSGWHKTIDTGLDTYDKDRGDKLKYNYKPRKLLDEGKGGFNVGSNNIANLDFLTTTKKISLSEEKQKLVFVADFLKSPKTYMDDDYSDDEKEKKEKARIKTKIGPEVQFLIGNNDGKKIVYLGGNSNNSQKMLRGELLGKRKKSKTKKRKRNSNGANLKNASATKKRIFSDYYQKKHRDNNVLNAIEQMENFIKVNDLGNWLTDLVNSGKDNDTIRLALKNKIGNQYKDQRISKMYTLKHALRSTYFDNADLIIPDNNEAIHAESNLLNKAYKKLKTVDVVIGSKVPCVACFAKFCEKNWASHLLQYTSSVWFSKPCMTQLGCDYEAKSPVEVVNYLNEIDQQIKGSIKKLKKLTKQDLKMYTGYQGNLKNEYFNDDSDSEGEESRNMLIERRRTRKKKKRK